MAKKRILICDDDTGILDMLSMMMEDYGYDVMSESNSLNIYKLIDKYDPEAILLDLWMPVLSGDQVIRVLKANPRTQKIPIIAFSASKDGKTIAEQAGANAYIAKPFDLDSLAEVMEHAL